MPQPSPSDPRSFVAGRVLADRYELIRALGRGGVGEVWLARNLRVDKLVAIKTVHPRWARDTLVRERFKGEALAANRTSHPNIVQVFDAEETDKGELYLVMEYVEGQDLHSLQRDHGQFTLAQVHAIMQQVCSATAAAHSVGVIHRDLKPENIMVSGPLESPRIKVMDFGIAAQVRSGDDASNSRMTAPGVRIGTPHYMAPEQGGSSAPDPRLDVYALGVIMFELLTGVLPFDHEDPLQVLAQKLARPAPSLLTMSVQDLPPGVALLVDAALSTDPRARPPDASVFLASLDAAVSAHATQSRALPVRAPVALGALATPTEALDEGPPVGPSETVAPVASADSVLVHEEPGQRWALIAVALLALLALAGVGYVVTGQANAAPEGEAAVAPDLAPEAPTEPSVEPAPTEAPAPAETPPETAGSPKEEAPSESTTVPVDAKPATGAKRASPQNTSKPAPTLPELDEEPDQDAKPSSYDKCLRVPARAKDARNAHDWATLLRLAKMRSCFKSQSDRTKLLTKAYLELKRFDDCARAGAKSDDSEVQRWVKICQARSK